MSRRRHSTAQSERRQTGSPAIKLVRKELKIRLNQLHLHEGPYASFGAEYETAYCTALQAARRVLLAMRHSGDIDDDAFHTQENDLGSTARP
jgi:monovalent cation/hydrogen antiporter